MSKTSKPTDAVIIRVWKGNDNDIFALFPFIPATDTCVTCYQHVGQHCAADYTGCIAQSRPATAEEAAPLLAELRKIGYNPRVIKLAGHAMRQAACV